MKQGNELKKIVDELEKELERYKRLIESVSDYIYTVKIEKGVAVETIHEPGCVVVTGYTSKEFEDDPFLWYRMIYDEDRSAVTERASRLAEGREMPPLEHRVIHKTGKVVWVRNTSVLRHDEKGDLIAYDGLIEDITERKRMGEALRESEEKFRSISASAVDAIVMMDDETRVSYWNEAAERVFGFSRDEALGKDLHRLIVHPRFNGDFQKGFKRFRDTGDGPIIGKTVELAGIRKDGTEFVAEHSISAVKIKGKWNAIGVIRDVSGRKRLEEEIKQRLDDVERMNRLLVNRELRMKELKDENDSLRKKLEESEKK